MNKLIICLCVGFLLSATNFPCFSQIATIISLGDPAYQKITTGSNPDKSDWERITKAIGGAGTHKLIFFPAGAYLIHKPLKIGNGDCRLLGEASKGDPDGAIIKWDPTGLGSYGGGNYLISPDLNAAPTFKYTFENLCFCAKYAIDLRTKPAKIASSSCCFSNCDFQSGGTFQDGIAINIENHDFTIIKECAFYGYSGFCAIRIGGDVPNVKSSTQIKVLDCNMAGASKIGISLDLTQTSIIRGCDFSGNSICCIDIGGKLFNENFPGAQNLAYTYTFNPNSTLNRWFQNITIENNHFENFQNAIYAAGSNYMLSFGLYIDNNNFAQSLISNNSNANTNIRMMDIRYVNNIRTNNNDMNYWAGSTPPNIYWGGKVYGIALANCPNACLTYDRFYKPAKSSDQNSTFQNAMPPWAIDYYDSAQVSTPTILKGDFGGFGILNWPKKWIIPNTTIDFSQSTINATLPAVGTMQGSKASLFTPISATNTLATNQTLVLIPNLNAVSTGMVYLTIGINGLATFSTTWSLGFPNAVTKVSGETTGNFYTINYDGTNLIITSKYAGSSTFVVSGYFIGMSRIQ
jgi:hypothetical protein